MKRAWLRAAEFSNISLDPTQTELMDRYGAWLVDEAVRAGGIGPGETDRIEVRHLADSVLFASQLDDAGPSIWDLGTGVGLPGIPLAICLPDHEFLLIDRSTRRADLTRRAVRILDLENCQVRQGEIQHLTGSPDVIVSRASLPPDALLEIAHRRLGGGGRAVIGGSWTRPPRHRGWTTIEIPPDVLDQTVWLLIMRRE